MRTYEVRNKLTGMVIAEVAVERPEDIMDKVMEETGAAIEEIAAALGKDMSEVREALDIVESVGKKSGKSKAIALRPQFARRSLFVDRIDAA